MFRRSLSLSLICLFLAGVRVFAQAGLPAVASPVPSQALGVNDLATIDLRNHFEAAGVTGQVVQMRFLWGPTNITGAVNVEMLPAAAPLSVANFLNYGNAGKYSDTAIHRSVTASRNRG